MDRGATKTVMAPVPHTPPDRAPATTAPTARERHLAKVEARPTRTRMAVKRRVNTEKGRLTRTPMAAALQLNTGRARRIRTFMEGPLRGLTEKVRPTPAPMATALRIIRRPLIMAIIRPQRRTPTHQHAPTATGGRPGPQVQAQPPVAARAVA